MKLFKIIAFFIYTLIIALPRLMADRPKENEELIVSENGISIYGKRTEEGLLANLRSEVTIPEGDIGHSRKLTEREKRKVAKTVIDIYTDFLGFINNARAVGKNVIPFLVVPSDDVATISSNLRNEKRLQHPDRRI